MARFPKVGLHLFDRRAVGAVTGETEVLLEIRQQLRIVVRWICRVGPAMNRMAVETGAPVGWVRAGRHQGTESAAWPECLAVRSDEMGRRRVGIRERVAIDTQRHAIGQTEHLAISSGTEVNGMASEAAQVARSFLQGEPGWQLVRGIRQEAD